MNIAKQVIRHQYKSLWVSLRGFPWLQGEPPSRRTGVKDVVTLLVNSRGGNPDAMGVRGTSGMYAIFLPFKRSMRDCSSTRFLT
jgi:hypothetical protein